MLGIPCVTVAQRVEVQGDAVVVDRIMTDGHDTVEAPMPAMVTVSNELGQARYPTLRGIMAASRKQPTVWSAADLGVDSDGLRPRVETQELYVPTQEQDCEYIEGDSDEEKGINLALKLYEAKLI